MKSANERMARIEKVQQARARRLRALVLLALLAVMVITPASAKYVQTLNLAGLDGVTNKDLVDALWPVGSIYMSIGNDSNATGDPNVLFSGTTWVRWSEGRVPMGVGSNGTTTYAANATGGSDLLTLAAANIPQVTGALPTHTHTMAHTHNEYDHYAGTGTLLITENTSSGTGTAYGGWAKANEGTRTGKILQTGDSSAANTGGSSAATVTVGTAAASLAKVDVRQPYTTCYMWKRTA